MGPVGWVVFAAYVLLLGLLLGRALREDLDAQLPAGGSSADNGISVPRG